MRLVLLFVLVTFCAAVPVDAAARGPDPVLARLTWDAAGADVDLHVFGSSGAHGWYRDRAGVAGLTLSADVVGGPGEETVAGAGRAGVGFGVCWYGGTASPDGPPIDVVLTVAGAGDGRVLPTHVRLQRPGSAVVVGGADAGVPARWCRGEDVEKGPPSGPYPPSSSPPQTDLALETRFRPRLRLDSGERWRPLEAGAFLGERADGHAAHTLCSVTQPFDRHPDRCVPGSSLALSGLGVLLTHRSPTAVLDLDGDGRTTAAHDAVSPVAACRGGGLVDCDAGARAAIYARRFALGGYTVLDYWLLYRFNDAPFSSPLLRLTDNDHEGDWEGVSVGVPPGAAGAARTGFDWVAYAGHGAPPRRYLRGLLSCDGDNRPGSCAKPGADRAHVYVARGTHASYPMACRGRGGLFALPSNLQDLSASRLLGCHQTGVASRGPDGALPEGSFDGTRRWGADDDPEALRRLPSSGSFADWPGRWGLPGAVRGPAFQFANRAEASDPALRVAASAGPSTPAARAAAPGPITSCEDWLADAVAVLVCDPDRLAAAFAAGELGAPGELALAAATPPPAAGARREAPSGATVADQRPRGWPATATAADTRPAACAPGIAQLGGGLLRPGERVTLTGATTPGEQLVVRALGAAGPTEARMVLDGDEGAVTIAVGGREQATISATTASGRRLPAAPTTRIAPRPRSLRVRRHGRRVWVAFRATTHRSLVALLDARHRPLRTRRLRTRPGGAVRIWLSARPAARAVGVSAERAGVPGAAVLRPVLSLSPEPA
jgi:hypothetical protein